MGGEFGMDISDSELDEQPDGKWFDGKWSELDGEQPGSDGEQFDGEWSHENSDDE